MVKAEGSQSILIFRHRKGKAVIWCDMDKCKNERVDRCWWVNLDNPLYVEYHDKEWGVPEHSDERLFEMLILETFQAGLTLRLYH